MVERNSADCGQQLSHVFSDDEAFQADAAIWAHEEKQHGIALGRWAELADSTFNFDAAFTHSKDLYRIPVHATHSVRGSQSVELSALCIFESGTSSFYSAIRDAVHKPVLRAICRCIASNIDTTIYLLVIWRVIKPLSP